MSAGRGALPGAPGAAGALCSPTAAGTRSAASWTVQTGSAVPAPRGDLHVARHDDAAAHQLPHVQLVDVSGEENNTKSKWSI